MRCCCVPMCTSSTRRRDPGVSFHEVPADLDLRQKWLKVIARKDWEPSATCNSSVVCSKHFAASDFKENTKIRVLKKGAIPSVFPGYPSYMTPKAPQVRRDRDPESRKRAMALDGDKEPGPSKRRRAAVAIVQNAPSVRDSLVSADIPGSNEWPAENAVTVRNDDVEECRSTEKAVQDAHVLSEEVRVFAKRSFATQGKTITQSVAFVERRKWRRREQALRQQVAKLKKTVAKQEEELRCLKDDSAVNAFLEVVAGAQQKHVRAAFILDQVTNYKKKRATWSELTVRYSVILRNMSAKAYEYIRSEELLRLPCRNTLQKYIGTSTGEVGFSSLVRFRLQAELENLAVPQSRVCSLVIVEMHIRQKLEYNKQQDSFIGDVYMGQDLDHIAPDKNCTILANSLLCFLLCGLAQRYKIPVGYFFTKGCTAPELDETIIHVVKNTEQLGFEIVRVVTDNHKTNVGAMDILCKGKVTTSAPHPVDQSRRLFFAFDQCHIIKNVRSQFLSKDMGGRKEISSSSLKDLYKMQRGSTVKPIRFLTRKHIYPSNIEKMSVVHAVQIFSPPVTATLQYMRDQAGHACDVQFASVGPTVTFMTMMHKWFSLMDVSNTRQHIHRNDPDTKPFYDAQDERLQWLEETFLDYIEQMKNESHAAHFLSKETYCALVLTTKSNVECIRFLLTEKNFVFVLTRKLSSDPIEALFGFLRRTAGCNDAMDMRSVLCGIEKMLKTGIVSSSNRSNVNSSKTFCSTQAIPSPHTQNGGRTGCEFFPLQAKERLRELYTGAHRQRLPDTEVASIALIGGYIARFVSEKLSYSSCIDIVEKPKGNTPVDGLIAYQDRGGLKYPTKELVSVLLALKSYIDVVLFHRKLIAKPLQSSVEQAVQVLIDLPILRCQSCDLDHRKMFLSLLCKKFMKPLLSNHALDITDRNSITKMFQRKPLSRKVLKL